MIASTSAFPLEGHHDASSRPTPAFWSPRHRQMTRNPSVGTLILLTMPTASVRLSFRQHMREQVLLAARTLTIEKGWERVRISEVAQLVGVSRPTVYKEFTDKQGLGDALVVAEGERFLEGIFAVLARHGGDVEGGITAAVSYTLHEAEASPLLKAVLTLNRSNGGATSESTGVLPLLPTSASLLELSSAALVTWFNEQFPGLDRDDVNDVADALVRLTVSHVVLPTADSEATGRRISRIALRYLGVGSGPAGSEDRSP